MVAGQYDPFCAKRGDPAARFGALAGFVDHDQVETSLSQKFFITGGRRTYDTGLIQDVLHCLLFEQAGIGFQLPGLASQGLFFSRRRSSSGESTGTAEQLFGFPQHVTHNFHRLMVVDLCIEREIPQLFIHSCGVSDPDNPCASADQTSQQVIDRSIAGCTGEHFFAT